ncbi:J domain-containing protein [Gordonia sp. MP11Mi]|uniref:J domain-containing protein n=1 Tax=Gordonia sp. MP11Mi TaxID=3022769 RepID=A0AA97CYX2_9ACTN
MAHINLYESFGLDPRASSDDLWRTLTDRLATATEPATQHQIQTARAILSDPSLRAQYDARLADPSAPVLDPAGLDQLAGSPSWGSAPPPSTPTPPVQKSGSRPSVPLMIAVGVLVVVVAIVASVIVVSNTSDNSTANTAASSSTEATTKAGTNGPTNEAPAPSAVEPTAPVEGAYVGAGGPRPPGAIALPTYVSKYGKVKSAHLLTPTGGIGCDFQTADSDGKQGQCGVRSMNRPDSPLGTETLAGSTKGKWLFQFKDNRVGDPVSSSGTTGWMNQPANDGYKVPVVEYGKQYYFEDWVCASEMIGLTCWNTTTGSGVFLANEKAETFDGAGTTAPTTSDGRSGGETIVLGSMPPNGRGYGTEKPTEVYAGGSPTSRITDVTWSSWGGDTAEGTGTGTYREDGRVGREQYIPATIIASDIGMCDGKRAYLTIAWYFPSKGETASPDREMKTCSSQ